MIEETNKPPAFYTKPDTTKVATPVPTSITEKPKDTVGMQTNQAKKKSMYGVVAIALFVIIALMGVFIAQRQVNRDGGDIETVAPTAPDSKPEAYIKDDNNCSLSFYVQPAEASCLSKTAWTDFTTSNGEEIPNNTEFNIGDEFIFRITVQAASAGTSRDVVVTDLLPNSLTFVDDSDNSPEITASGQNIRAELGDLSSSDQTILQFKVRVNSSDLGNATNTAIVSTNTVDSSGSIGCSYNYSTVAGVVECKSKQLFDSPYLDTAPIPDGSALTRGQEYMYRVTMNVENRSQGELKVHDLIPEAFEYIDAMPNSRQYIVNDPTSGLLIANFGEREDEVVILEFIVRVIDNPSLGKFTNTAQVYAFPANSRQKEPTANADICLVSHSIIPVGTAECEAKRAFTDFGGTEIVAGSEVEIGQSFIYQITVSAEDITTGGVTIVDVIPDNLVFNESASGNTPGILYNSSTREISISYDQMSSGEKHLIEFEVQVIASPDGNTITNQAVVTTNSDTSHSCELILIIDEVYECLSECETNAQCEEISSDHMCYQGECKRIDNPTSDTCSPATSPTPTPTPEIGCNDECETNNDCSVIGHICSTTSDGDRCRLEINVDSSTCTPPQYSPTPTPTPTATPTPTPVVTPAPGCNETCSTNADCSSINHICQTIADGSNKCRLENYPDSSTCTVPIASSQPVLPEMLPETGPADWLNWLKAGLVTLGVGTALFLLL